MDVLIKNAEIITGDGKTEPFSGDVLISNKIISAIKDVPLSQQRAVDKIIEAEGLILMPSFIDVHNHGSLNGIIKKTKGIPIACYNSLMVGVTKRVCGVDGYSPGLQSTNAKDPTFSQLDGEFPDELKNRTINEYLSWLKKYIVTDVGFYLGHSSLRNKFMDSPTRPANTREIKSMNDYISKYSHNYLGLSAGFIYSSAIHSDDNEIYNLLKCFSSCDLRPITYAPHLRSESYGILGSIENAINLAKQSNVNYMVEHAKIAGNENTWKLDSLISLVENASRSQPIVSNMYPYLEGSTNILAILPPGIKDAMLNNRVSDISNDIYRKACDEVDNDIYQWDNFVRFCNGYSGIIALSFKKDEYNKFTGKSIDYIIKHISGYPPNMPNGMQALCKIASDNDNEITIMTKYGDDMVLESLLTKPWMSICSDSLYGSSSIRHPRNLGSHPRAIRLMSKLGIPFKDISWRLSTLPSLFLGLNNPAITSQADASLVLIDPQLISETNSFENPQNEPDGIKFVITHGTIAVDNGKLNSRLSPIGQVLTRHHSELNTDK